MEVIAALLLICYNFDSSEIERWGGMVAHCAQLESYLPKDTYELLDLKQNDVQFHQEGNLVNIIIFNFIRDLQWNNMEIKMQMLSVQN